MSKKVLIIGGDGHGSVIASCIKDNYNRYNDDEWEVVGFLNDFEENIGDYPVYGKTTEIQVWAAKDYYFAWGIHLIGRNIVTKKVFDRMQIPIDRLATVIHRSAFIGEGVVLEPGCFVMANSYIAPRSCIGMCSMIKANVNIGHDVICGPLCHFAMGAIVGSHTHIGLCSDVAIGSVVLEYRNIGDYSMLGAHSLLTHNIQNNEIFIGTPAKFLKNIKED